MKTLAASRSNPIELPKGRQLTAMERWLKTGATFDAALERSAWGAPISGGAVDSTSGVVIQNRPLGLDAVINPEVFFAATEPGFVKHEIKTHPGFAQPFSVKMPEVGLTAKVILTFEGTLTCSATGTTTAAWPYGLAEDVAYTANGTDDLFSCSGLALKALERMRHINSANNDADLVGPGIGAGLTVPAAATSLRLTYEIPLAIDEASLVGSIVAQTRQLSMLLKTRTAAQAKLFSGGGTVTLTGDWHVSVELFKIPVADNGQLVLPDVNWLHGFNNVPFNFANTGDVKVALTRTEGQLQRMLVQVAKDWTVPTFYDPAVSTDISEFRFEYGANERPYTFNPAANLVRQNALDYNGKLPYSFVALDLVRDNPARDTINIRGLTEAYWVSKIVAAPTNGQTNLIAETLYAARN